jgi:malonyl-CoA decarboxylase
MATINIFERTVERLSQALRSAAGTVGWGPADPLHPDLPDRDAERLRERIKACIDGHGGEVSARARAAELGHAYLRLSAAGRARFLGVLAREYGVDRDRLNKAVAALGVARSDAANLKAQQGLRAALEPPRLRLLTNFNAVPEGVKFLVDMRADLLPLVKDDAALGALDADLQGLLAAWFDVGFLDLARITWNAPAALLEKLIAYEAVHRIRSWTDLKNRLDSDRRCYAFFHPRMPDEPLIFVEVALVNGMAANVQALLDEQAPAMDPATADSAIFYSISNCQRGLSGVSFGNFLIKRVVDALKRDLPRLEIFATLSPIPGFRAWLDPLLAQGGEDLATSREAGELAAAAGGGARGAGAAMAALLERPDWPRNEAVAGALRAPLMRLGARYLLREVRDGRARDRVCHFHLSNGARVGRLNWLGDVSPSGLAQSAGLMVNYHYKLDEIEANHEAYTGAGTIVAASAVSRLLKP